MPSSVAIAPDGASRIASHARPPHLQGIETRLDADGYEHYRAALMADGKRQRGHWRDYLTEARADYAELSVGRPPGRP